MIRIGSYFRKSDSRYIRRWKCRGCKKTVSEATGTVCFGQNKRRVNFPVLKLLNKGMTERGVAWVLGINPKTVARKKKFLSDQCLLKKEEQLFKYKLHPLDSVQLDEMETFEHTKMKPISIAVAVSTKTREILAIQASSMPAKGLLAKKSREKYGKRVDGRSLAMGKVLKKVSDYLLPTGEIQSDKNPKYPGWIRKQSQTWTHKTFKGRRGCIVGQGELKSGRYDPLFSLNHTCAMIRANVSRLFRRTWNTTKKLECLQDHLNMYAYIHNFRIQEELLKSQAQQSQREYIKPRLMAA